MVNPAGGDYLKELSDLAQELDRLYDTERTNALIDFVHDVVSEIRQFRHCQCCDNVTTRWFCDKPHQLN